MRTPKPLPGGSLEKALARVRELEAALREAHASLVKDDARALDIIEAALFSVKPRVVEISDSDLRRTFEPGHCASSDCPCALLRDTAPRGVKP